MHIHYSTMTLAMRIFLLSPNSKLHPEVGRDGPERQIEIHAQSFWSSWSSHTMMVFRSPGRSTILLFSKCSGVMKSAAS